MRENEIIGKWGGDTACGVALKNARGTWQFSSMAKAVNRSSEPSGWRWDDSVSATLTVTRYGWEPDGDWRYVRYYMRRLYSAPKNVARFDAEFKKIGELGHHEFYAPVETLFDELSRLILGKPKEKEWFARCERQSPDSHDSVDKPEGRIDRIHKHHRR